MSKSDHKTLNKTQISSKAFKVGDEVIATVQGISVHGTIILLPRNYIGSNGSTNMAIIRLFRPIYFRCGWEEYDINFSLTDVRHFDSARNH